jgi:O-methyltransferase involved in polyketide biosynthesis
MSDKIAIHETAFVTSAFRAGNEQLSADRFAHLWPTKKTAEHAKTYMDAVSHYEATAHCLRNRYFYEEILRLTQTGAIQVLLNFGCGFSMYPFLLPAELQHIEIDMVNIIDFKQKKINNWQEQGVLPERNIKYMTSNFNDLSATALISEIKNYIGAKKTCILLEGVLFFLSSQDTQSLFNLFDSIQKVGDYIGSVSFTPDEEKHKLFQRLIGFVENNLSKNEQFQYQTIADSYYENLKNYQLIDHQNTLTLSERFIDSKLADTGNVLNEHMYLLQKK